ncbi:MAG: hypothetical protein M0Z66_05575 [Thermaerobacter sp.]|nr:hypothetical protein [Thermaerobacter sp.]
MTVGLHTILSIDKDGVVTTKLLTRQSRHADLGASSAPLPNIYVGEQSDTTIRGNPYVTCQIHVATDTHYAINTRLNPMVGPLTAALLWRRLGQALRAAAAPVLRRLPDIPAPTDSAGQHAIPGLLPAPLPCPFCLLFAPFASLPPVTAAPGSLAVRWGGMQCPMPLPQLPETRCPWAAVYDRA